MIDERFIIPGVLIGVIGNFNYILNTIKGRTKPNRVTWSLWCVLSTITFLAMLDKHAAVTALIATFASALITFATVCASFFDKKAYWKITQLDYICGALSLFGIFAWLVTQEGNLAIVFTLSADLFATMPTIVKSYKFPDTESWPNYAGGALSALITILTVKVWTFASIAWPADIFILCSFIFILIQLKPSRKINIYKA